MKQLSQAAVERAMKLQDVMLRAIAKRITWYQAAEILGISCRLPGMLLHIDAALEEALRAADGTRLTN
jgi:hypothetical protein